MQQCYCFSNEDNIGNAKWEWGVDLNPNLHTPKNSNLDIHRKINENRPQTSPGNIDIPQIPLANRYLWHPLWKNFQDPCIDIKVSIENNKHVGIMLKHTPI